MEVKPTVGAELHVVQPQHIAQVLVQAYYAMIQYKLPSIMCALTDRVTFFQGWDGGGLSEGTLLIGLGLINLTSSQEGKMQQLQLVKVVWAKMVSTANKKAVAFMAKCLQMNWTNT